MMKAGKAVLLVFVFSAFSNSWRPGTLTSPAGIANLSAAAGEPAACAEKPDEAAERPAAREDLLHRRFLLKSVDGAAWADEGPTPSLEFLEGFRIAGKACNNFSGPAELTDGILKSPPLAMTRMFCFNEGLNRLDSMIGAMLAQGAQAVLTGDTLRLSGDGHTLEYAAADWVR